MDAAAIKGEQIGSTGDETSHHFNAQTLSGLGRCVRAASRIRSSAVEDSHHENRVRLWRSRLYGEPLRQCISPRLRVHATARSHDRRLLDERENRVPSKLTEEGSGPFDKREAGRSRLLRAVGKPRFLPPELPPLPRPDPPRPARYRFRASTHTGQVAASASHLCEAVLRERPWMAIDG